MKRYIAASAACLIATHAIAADSTRKVGSWLLQSQKDEFTDKTVVLSLTATSDASAGFGLKCSDGELIVMAIQGSAHWPFDEGEADTYEIRVDGGEVFKGDAAGPSHVGVVQLADTPPMIKALQGAKRSIALRIHAGSLQPTYTFPGRGAQEAIGAVLKECPNVS